MALFKFMLCLYAIAFLGLTYGFRLAVNRYHAAADAWLMLHLPAGDYEF